MQILKNGFLLDKDGSSSFLWIDRPDIIITKFQKPDNTLKEF